jgi:hypothetical protein
MVDWVQGFRSREEVLQHATAHAFADASAMKAMGDRVTNIHLRKTYDLDLQDVENIMHAFIRTYLDPTGLRSEEPVESLEGDSGVLGAFFIGMLAGWRYNQLNDHGFEGDDEKEEG